MPEVPASLREVNRQAGLIVIRISFEIPGVSPRTQHTFFCSSKRKYAKKRAVRATLQRAPKFSTGRVRLAPASHLLGRHEFLSPPPARCPDGPTRFVPATPAFGFVWGLDIEIWVLFACQQAEYLEFEYWDF